MITRQSFRYIPFFILLFFPKVAYSSWDEICEIPNNAQPVAHWNFNKDGFSSLTNGIVTWHDFHGGVKAIPDTDLQGVRFHYDGKGPEGDATSELRYKITRPMAHVWEHLKIWQPKNFYHRQIVKIKSSQILEPEIWKPGDKVTSENGNGARVAKASEDVLYVIRPDSIYSQTWGEGKTITNTSNNASFTSKESKYLPGNNKLSAMWQGKYSNAAMIVGTRPLPINRNGKEGNGYCDAQTSKSGAHGPTAMKQNQLEVGENPVCFDVRNNGSVVEVVIERKRASVFKPANGVYKIWTRTQVEDWQLIYSNEAVVAYQAENNYFDSGYVFGWSNSGFAEDTNFYLLEWGLWDTKPSFLP